MLDSSLPGSIPPECTGRPAFSSSSGQTCGADAYANLLRKSGFTSSSVIQCDNTKSSNCTGGQRPLFSYNIQGMPVSLIAPSGDSFQLMLSQSGSIPDLLLGSLKNLSFIGNHVNIEYTQNKGANDVDAKAVFEKGKPTSLSTRSFMLTYNFTAEMISGSVQSTFEVQQIALVSAAVPLASTCPAYTSTMPNRRGVVYTDFGDFATRWQKAYPDLGVNINKLRLDSTSVNVDYELVIYPSVIDSTFAVMVRFKSFACFFV